MSAGPVRLDPLMIRNSPRKIAIIGLSLLMYSCAGKVIIGGDIIRIDEYSPQHQGQQVYLARDVLEIKRYPNYPLLSEIPVTFIWNRQYYKGRRAFIDGNNFYIGQTVYIVDFDLLPFLDRGDDPPPEKQKEYAEDIYDQKYISQQAMNDAIRTAFTRQALSKIRRDLGEEYGTKKTGLCDTLVASLVPFESGRTNSLYSFLLNLPIIHEREKIYLRLRNKTLSYEEEYILVVQDTTGLPKEPSAEFRFTVEPYRPLRSTIYGVGILIFLMRYTARLGSTR